MTTTSRVKTILSSSESAGTGTTGTGRYGIELARIWCEHEYCARELGVRCGYPSLGDTSRRHVHTLGAALFSPAACLLALAAAAPGKGADPRDALPSTHRATWLPKKHRQGAR